MHEPYIEWRKKENLRPLSLPNKEKFYLDLQNIEHSWSGRMDIGGIGNTFIVEAEQQLVNAIELFEIGYFDCAYFLCVRLLIYQPLWFIWRICHMKNATHI